MEDCSCVPVDLISKFRKVAKVNSDSNVKKSRLWETLCGQLCGQ